MKQGISILALACLFATGCAGTNFQGQGGLLGSRNDRAQAKQSRQMLAKQNAQSEIDLVSYGQGCDCGDICCDDTCCYGDCSGACPGDCCCGNEGSGLLNRMRERRNSGCGACGGVGCGRCLGRLAGRAGQLCPHRGGYPEMTTFNPGPPVGQVAYPYYTVRGPRDFLQGNPPPIGPY